MTDTSAPLSGALKTDLVTALDNHLAGVTADVNRVKAAIQADLPSVSATAVSIESLVKAEYAKLVADVKPVWKPWMTYVSVAVLAGAAVFAVHHFVPALF